MLAHLGSSVAALASTRLSFTLLRNTMNKKPSTPPTPPKRPATAQGKQFELLEQIAANTKQSAKCLTFLAYIVAIGLGIGLIIGFVGLMELLKEAAYNSELRR